MLNKCCTNSLQHGMALATLHIGCGDCGVEWRRGGTDSGVWRGTDGTEVEFSTDETAIAKKIEPEPCCIATINGAGEETSLPCRCGVFWQRAHSTAATWACYAQRH